MKIHNMKNDSQIQNETTSSTNIIMNRNRDCLACRYISGCGLIGAGLYITKQAKRFEKQKVCRYTMLIIAGGTVLLGAARILNLPPFRDTFQQKSISV